VVKAMPCVKRAARRGNNLIYLLALVFIVLLVGALGVDFAYYFAAQNRLQTAADSAALAAAQTLYNSASVDPNGKQRDARNAAQAMLAENEPGLQLAGGDVLFGFIAPGTNRYNPQTFRTPSVNPAYAWSGGFNAVSVHVRRGEGSGNAPLRTVLANMVGIRQMNAEAHSVAFIDQTVGTVTGGLRPLYVCHNVFARAMQDGVPDNDIIRVYGDHAQVNGQQVPNCPPLTAGNWSYADLRDCEPGSPGQNTVANWFANGYPGTVGAAGCQSTYYSTQPGNFIASIRPEMDQLIAAQTIFPVPVYTSWRGTGSNAQVGVTSFVGFQISSYRATGSQAGRYIEGRFRRFICRNGCRGGNANGPAPGGALVRVRLAARS